jgi:hypothetical protein
MKPAGFPASLSRGTGPRRGTAIQAPAVNPTSDSVTITPPALFGFPPLLRKRGVVAAASYEARSFGVRSAMPSTVAIRKCAELVFVPPRFDVYREGSKQVQAIFKDYTRWSNRSLSMKPTST